MKGTMPLVLFDAKQVGVVGDGNYGHEHVRDMMAVYLQSIRNHHTLNRRHEIDRVIASLKRPMPPDAADEDRAITLLSEVTADALEWAYESGNLVLRYKDSPEVA